MAPPAPEDPDQAMAAVKQLQGAGSLTVHLYGQYTGADPGEGAHLLSDARWWSQNGVRVEMVLRYRPASAALGLRYPAWVGDISSQLALLPGVSAVQVGNELNNSNRSAGDGSYPGAISAVAKAVPAARAAVTAAGRPDIRIGVNWAAGESPCTPDPMFPALRRAGGNAFVDALGWVGIDVYPGTWSPPAADSTPSSAQIDATMSQSLDCLRHVQMTQAGLPSQVTITVGETGYPTDAARSESTQAAVLRQIVASVQRLSTTLNITDLRWFSLRDANTSSGQLENGYGLLRSDYSPKPAFVAFRQIIAAGS